MIGSISKKSFDMYWILWDQNKNTNTNTNMHTPITAVQLDVSVTTQ